MRTTVRMTVIGRATLYLIENMEDGWQAPRYYLERIVRHEDGTFGPRVIYGEEGFADPEDAFQFGQDWCKTVGQTREQLRTS